MNANIHSIQFKADAELEAFIEARLDKLNQFHDRITGAEVYLRLDKNNTGNKIAQIKLNVPGKDLFAKRQSASFEQSTDEVVEALRRQITRMKGKQTMA